MLLAFLLFANLTDVEFARPGGVPLKLDAFLPEKPGRQPAVVLVHGGGWEAGDKRTYIRPWFDVLTEAGIAWFSIDYRLAPKWKHPAAVEDVETGIRWVQKHPRVNARRVVVMGESAGGHLAALAALRGKVGVVGLVSFYGVHDLPSWKAQRGELPRNISLYLRDVSDAGLREASPSAYVSRGVPMLLIHGTADKGVPSAQSTDLCKAAASRCEVMLIEGAPHGVENWESDARFQVWKPKLVEWLRGLFGGGEAVLIRPGRPEALLQKTL